MFLSPAIFNHRKTDGSSSRFVFFRDLGALLAPSVRFLEDIVGCKHRV